MKLDALPRALLGDDPSIGSLCTGYGGLELAVRAAVGGHVAWHSEIDPHARAILEWLYPDVPNLGDLTALDWTQVERVDVLTAGYPCQPFSQAGLRKGTDDERHLWPYVADAIRVLRPRLVVLENVAGHLSLGFDVVLGDLAALGFDAEWGFVRASDAGAPHGRARLFIAAANTDDRAHDGQRTRSQPGAGGAAAADTGQLPGVAGRLSGPGEAAGGRARTVAAGRRRAPAPHAAGDAWWVGDGDGGAAADSSGDGRVEGRTESEGLVGGPDAAERRASSAADTDVAGRGGLKELDGRAPAGLDGEHRGHADGRGDGADGEPGTRVDWGVYESAIRRWEAIIGRPAPRPVEPRRLTRASRRDCAWELGLDGWAAAEYVRRGWWGALLSPPFVEWMMGLALGHVTGAPGVSRSALLRVLGNGVVPPQALLAVEFLLTRLLEGWSARVAAGTSAVAVAAS